jgi:hypothetical protein
MARVDEVDRRGEPRKTSTHDGNPHRNAPTVT